MKRKNHAQRESTRSVKLLRTVWSLIKETADEENLTNNQVISKTFLEYYLKNCKSETEGVKHDE